MELGLENTVALVTGASGNIGLATCEALAREGVKVIATDMPGRTGGGDYDWRELDVTEEAAWEELIATIAKEFGRLDILVNNAGIALMDGITSTSVDDWDRTQAINVKGVFLGMKHAASLMAETGKNRAGGASLINIASGAADHPAAFSIAYCASKAAVRMATRVAAVEFGMLGYPIRVNSVHPGVVESDMMDRILEKYSALTGGTPVADLRKSVVESHPMGKFIEPAEVADTVVFLASTASRHTHGDALHVDGGHATT